jgi:hypothetical protein
MRANPSQAITDHKPVSKISVTLQRNNDVSSTSDFKKPGMLFEARTSSTVFRKNATHAPITTM